MYSARQGKEVLQGRALALHFFWEKIQPLKISTNDSRASGFLRKPMILTYFLSGFRGK